MNLTHYSGLISIFQDLIQQPQTSFGCSRVNKLAAPTANSTWTLFWLLPVAGRHCRGGPPPHSSWSPRPHPGSCEATCCVGALGAEPERLNKQVSQKSPELAQKRSPPSERVREAACVTLALQLFGELSSKGSCQRICVSCAELILFLCRWQVSPASPKC